MTKRLDTKQFLEKLEIELKKSKGKKSLYLSQKRLVNDFESSTKDEINDLPSNVIETAPIQNTTTYPILIRASVNSSDNKLNKKDRTKFSTVVENDKLDAFWSEYLHVLKSGFIGLKKKEKKKSKKSKTSGKIIQ